MSGATPGAAAGTPGAPETSAPFIGTLEGGQPWPMGAHFDGTGVNFAVFSAHATRIELCLFDARGERELARLALPARSGDVWHGRLAGAAPGLVYALRAHGPWRPDRGHRFNPQKLLLDPWARELMGRFDYGAPHAGADLQHPSHPDPRDNAAGALKCRVVAPNAPAVDALAPRPARPLADTVIYELHVRGFTRRMAGVPEAQRGTFAGLASPAALAHLQRLGVTAVCLLPVHQHLDEPRLHSMGLSNYWGYNTLGFFCPEPTYAATANPREEFRAMVRALHGAGIEVLLDVVYNHTAEGDERGPTLAWRGLDNANWYRHAAPSGAGQPLALHNWTGCGNAVNVQHPRVLQFVLDSLRHWVVEMGVDGFRFDLAPILGREVEGFDRHAAFFKAVAQDPVLQTVKLIAEPWDLGPHGWQTGQFPTGWLEWNDRFRDTVRAFWLGGDCTRGALALRLAGSSDLFQHRQRSPQESVNFVVAHDGYNLTDLVSYDLRHNEANGEHNRDGHGHNLSWNCGVEGPTTDPDVLARRARLKRALLATVLLAQGTPMLCAGDEMGHSQRGNNNPYCQDNDTTWLDWAHADEDLIAFTAHVLSLRRRLLPLGVQWYSGLPDARGLCDLQWLRRTGETMTVEHWDSRMSRIVGALIGAPGGGGAPLLLLLNGRDMDAQFQLPPGDWLGELDTTEPQGRNTWRSEGSAAYALRSRSVVLLRQCAAAGPTATSTRK